jgi:hypothetical protein
MSALAHTAHTRQICTLARAFEHWGVLRPDIILMTSLLAERDNLVALYVFRRCVGMACVSAFTPDIFFLYLDSPQAWTRKHHFDERNCKGTLRADARSSRSVDTMCSCSWQTTSCDGDAATVA